MESSRPFARASADARRLMRRLASRTGPSSGEFAESPGSFEMALPAVVPARADTGLAAMTRRYYGYTRFSVHSPGDGAWKASRGAQRDYRKQLYSDERMKLRTDIFVDLAAPIYQSWAERFNYRHIVHFSPDLPVQWRSRLEDAAVRYPCLLLDEVTDSVKTHQVIMTDIRAHSNDADLIVRFRVDDDDLLSSDYLDLLELYATPDHVGFAVSFGLGIGALYSNGRHSDFRLKREVLPSAGQAYIHQLDRTTGKMSVLRATAHNRIDTAVPVIFDSRSPMHLQTFHTQQDKEFGHADDPSSRLAQYPAVNDRVLLGAKFPTLPF